MARDKRDAAEQHQPAVDQYDRFGFSKFVGSYRDSRAETETRDWWRPWTYSGSARTDPRA
jgi:hypothetical protein